MKTDEFWEYFKRVKQVNPFIREDDLIELKLCKIGQPRFDRLDLQRSQIDICFNLVENGQELAQRVFENLHHLFQWNKNDQRPLTCTQYILHKLQFKKFNHLWNKIPLEKQLEEEFKYYSQCQGHQFPRLWSEIKNYSISSLDQSFP